MLPPPPHLHCLHQRVVGTLQKLGGEVLQYQSDAIRRDSLVGQVCYRASQPVHSAWLLLRVIRTLLQPYTIYTS